MVGVFIEGHRSKTGRAAAAQDRRRPAGLPHPGPRGAGVHHRRGREAAPGCSSAPSSASASPSPPEELDIPDDSSASLRRASKAIMARIARLREESLKELGLPLPQRRERGADRRARPNEPAVELAQSAGFCFGVDRAVSTVYRLLEEGKPAATLGPIIHNPQLRGGPGGPGGAGRLLPGGDAPRQRAGHPLPRGAPEHRGPAARSWASPMWTPPAPL